MLDSIARKKKMIILMEEKKWDAVLFNPYDAFLSPQGQWKKRLEALTGFTGSAGLCLYTPHEVPEFKLFVDARYSLQAKNQAPHVSVFTATDPLTYFENKAYQSTPSTLAINPWTISMKQADLYQEKLEKTGWILGYDDQQLIDSIVFSPEENSTPANLSWLPMDSDNFQAKCARLFPKCSQKVFLLCQPEDGSWLTQIRAWDSAHTPALHAYILVTFNDHDGRFKAHIFTSMPRFMPDETTDDYCFHAWEEIFSYYTHAPDYSKNPTLSWSHLLNYRDVYYDPAKTPAALAHRLNPVHTFSLQNLYHCRSIKNEWETHHMTHAHIQDGIALCSFLYWMDTQTKLNKHTEWSVSQQLEKIRQKSESYQRPSFQTIAAYGPNGAMIHYHPEQHDARTLGVGLFLLDSGGQYHFGTTDVTRTFWLSDKSKSLSSISLYTRKLYTAVLQGHIQAASLIFPYGTTGAQLDGIARSFLWQMGKDYAHSTGHGVGCYLNVHESPPAISSTSCHRLEPGMIFSIEPGFYRDGWGGIRLENLYTVSPMPQNPTLLSLIPLTLAPFDTKLILEQELTLPQLKWLNAYHEKVRTTLSPFLESATQQWLHDATRPLF